MANSRNTLRDGDRERVGDDEAADEQSDEPEAEQELLHDAGRLVDVVDLGGSLGLRGFDLGRRREQRLDCRCELVGRDAFARRDLDFVELAQLVEQLLSRGEVEDRDRGSADRRNRCELCDTRDRERAKPVDRRDADAVSDGEVLRRRGVLVDRDLAVADGPLAGRERQRVEPLVSGGVDAVGNRRRAATGDDLAVPAHEMGLVGDHTCSGARLRQLSHLASARQQERPAFAGCRCSCS